jgi:lysozyme
MSKTKRLLALVLVLVCALLLAACGSATTRTTVKTGVEPSSIRVPCETATPPPGSKPCIPQSAVKPDGHVAFTGPFVETNTLTGNEIHLSPAGARLIEGFEGFSSCRYFDGAGGVWTRGYGETEGINSGSPCISRSYAEHNLIYRAERFYGYAIKRLLTSFNQNEIDAQFSFLWNLGAAIDPPGSALAIGFQHHSCARILAYDRAGGVVLPGLVTRRRAECQRFHEPAHEETPAQHQARVHRERVARLDADYRRRRGLNSALNSHRCLHGYAHLSSDTRRKCTVWRVVHGSTNRDITRLHKLGIR